MDVDLPVSSSTPDMVLRSVEQVLLEEWGTVDHAKIAAIIDQRSETPYSQTGEWTTLKLPYQAPSCPPLPSWKQILHAHARHPLNMRNGLHDVCRISNTVVKFSGNPNVVEEAENILFLAEKRPALLIPTIFAVWKVLNEYGNPVFCVMMNFIEGINLSGDVFAELPLQAQETICAKVSAQIRYLRELESDYYGRVHRQGWLCVPPGITLHIGHSQSVTGPYNTYEDFCAAIYRADELHEATSHRATEWDAARRTKLWSCFPGWDPHEPKFTWLDPKLMNMIAQPIIRDGVTEDWKVFLIDWEFAGWYPAWVQSLQFSQRCVAWVRDYTQQPYPSGAYPLTSYRYDEILEMMVKEFDPKHKVGRPSSLCGWTFY